MKFRVSPFNITAALALLAILWYFIQALIVPDYDRHGWGAVFLLFPAIVVLVFCIGLDLILQKVFTNKKYSWLIITELIMLVSAYLYWKL